MFRDISVEYIDHMGDDVRVVNAARVSFAKEAHEMGDRESGLLKYLAKHNHFTPFTHCTITLRETVPIFVARQRFKHTVGFSYNEVSRRYVSDEPDFYAPKAWRRAAENVKQGSSSETIECIEHPHYGFTSAGTEYRNICGEALISYRAMIAAGVAPEQARMLLPQSMMTAYYVTGSLAAFARAYGLRADPHAQSEIRDLAAEWDRIIAPLFPAAWEALTFAEPRA